MEIANRADNMARQQHGFDFESAFCKATGAIPLKKGGKFDAILNNTHISLKTIKEGSALCLGDYYRGAATEHDFILVVGEHRGDRAHHYTTVWARSVTADEWRAAFAYTGATQMRVELKEISNLHVDDERWAEFIQSHKSAFRAEHATPIIELAPKRDHKTQKRIQTTMSSRAIRAFRADHPSPFEPPQLNRILELANSPKPVTDSNEPVTDSNEPVTDSNEPVMASNRDLDKFYTNESVVRDIVAAIDFTGYDVVIEPSAGAGAFLNALRASAPRAELLAFDIAPEPGLDGIIERADFLTVATLRRLGGATVGKRAIVVGNPPFGQAAAKVIRFINQCAKVLAIDRIVFIVPPSMTKESLIKRVSREFTLASAVPLPPRSFTFEGSPYEVPSCVQTWVRAPRAAAAPAAEPIGYSFLTPKEFKRGAFYDLEIIRVGGGAGTASVVLENPGAKYNYFIRLKIAPDDPNDPASFRAKVAARFNGERKRLAGFVNATTGPRSLSKPEMIPVLNNVVAQVASEFTPPSKPRMTLSNRDINAILATL